MTAEPFPRLLGDIGGTNARFAWQAARGASLTDIQTYPADDFPSLQDAMAHYLRVHAKPQPVDAAIGIANPVTGDQVQMTNHHWSFSIEAVRTGLKLQRFVVLNDFTALALSLPSLAPGEKEQVGGGAPVEGSAIALLGPGTGLGVSGLLPGPGGRGIVPLMGEGGHVSLPAQDAEEAAVIERLRLRFGHASAERALSGPGLVYLYEALCDVAGVPAQWDEAADVTSRALDGSDRQCVAAVDMFFSLLGSIAGNLALTLGSRAGVYIGGGIVPRLGDTIHRSRFRERFEKKGRFESFLKPIPVYVVRTAVSPALLGAVRALDDLPPPGA